MATTPKNTNHITTVKLNSPLIRGDQTISTVTLRKPKFSELKVLGMPLVTLLQATPATALQLIPIISEPTIYQADFDNDKIEFEDYVALQSAVLGFLLGADVGTKNE